MKIFAINGQTITLRSVDELVLYNHIDYGPLTEEQVGLET